MKSLLLAGVIALVVPLPTSAGSLEPSAAPAPTMRTLEELTPAWNRIIPAAQRFVDALDGSAVLDKETGLVWAKEPDSTRRMWNAALDYCTSLFLGGRKGWRLPNVEELLSLVELSQMRPSLPSGHPFQNIKAATYWTSSTHATYTEGAWAVGMDGGSVELVSKEINTFYVWPVRSGQ